MKNLLSIALLLMCLGIQAQERKVEFKLQPTGAFLSEDNKDFVVVDFEGKTASELYSMVKDNVMSFYNSPKEVMSESEGSVITIYAHEKSIWYVKSLGAIGVYGGYYNIVFRFKDGKIRIDAPTINKELKMTGGGFTNTIGIPSSVYLSSCAKKVCNGKTKKDKEKKLSLENVVNTPINYLLGLSPKQQQKKVDEDW